MYMIKIPVVSKDEIIKDWCVALDEADTAHEFQVVKKIKTHPHLYPIADIFELRMQNIWLRMQHSCKARYTDSVFLSRFGFGIDVDVLNALAEHGYNIAMPPAEAVGVMQLRIAERGVGICSTTTSL